MDGSLNHLAQLFLEPVQPVGVNSTCIAQLNGLWSKGSSTQAKGKQSGQVHAKQNTQYFKDNHKPNTIFRLSTSKQNGSDSNKSKFSKAVRPKQTNTTQTVNLASGLNNFQNSAKSVCVPKSRSTGDDSTSKGSTNVDAKSLGSQCDAEERGHCSTFKDHTAHWKTDVTQDQFTADTPNTNKDIKDGYLNSLVQLFLPAQPVGVKSTCITELNGLWKKDTATQAKVQQSEQVHAKQNKQYFKDNSKSNTISTLNTPKEIGSDSNKLKFAKAVRHKETNAMLPVNFAAGLNNSEKSAKDVCAAKSRTTGDHDSSTAKGSTNVDAKSLGSKCDTEEGDCRSFQDHKERGKTNFTQNSLAGDILNTNKDSAEGSLDQLTQLFLGQAKPSQNSFQDSGKLINLCAKSDASKPPVKRDELRKKPHEMCKEQTLIKSAEVLRKSSSLTSIKHNLGQINRLISKSNQTSMKDVSKSLELLSNTQKVALSSVSSLEELFLGNYTDTSKPESRSVVHVDLTKDDSPTRDEYLASGISTFQRPGDSTLENNHQQDESNKDSESGTTQEKLSVPSRKRKETQNANRELKRLRTDILKAVAEREQQVLRNSRIRRKGVKFLRANNRHYPNGYRSLQQQTQERKEKQNLRENSNTKGGANIGAKRRKNYVKQKANCQVPKKSSNCRTSTRLKLSRSTSVTKEGKLDSQTSLRSVKVNLNPVVRCITKTSKRKTQDASDCRKRVVSKPPSKEKAKSTQKTVTQKGEKSVPNKKASATETVKSKSAKQKTPEIQGLHTGSSLFTLSDLEHASNTLVPLQEIQMLEDFLHKRPVGIGLGSPFDSKIHPGGIWKSIVNEG